MPNVLGSLQIELSANTAKFVDALSKAAYTAQQSAKNISREFSSLQAVASQTFGAFGAANPAISQFSFALSTMGRAAASAMKEFGSLKSGIGAITSITAGATAGLLGLSVGAITIAVHAAESAAKLHELSQATGVSVETLSGLSFAAKAVGVDIETLAKGLERMDKSAVMAAISPHAVANGYALLGVSVRDANGQMRPSVDIFEDIAQKFHSMPDGALKTAAAMQIFGRGGAALIPVLNQGSEAIKKWLEYAQKTGALMSGETAEAAHHFQEELAKIQIAVTGLENKLMQALLPALTTIADKLADFLSTGPDLSWIGDMVKQFVAAGADMILVSKTVNASINSMASGWTAPVERFKKQIDESFPKDKVPGFFDLPRIAGHDINALVDLSGSEVLGDYKGPKKEALSNYYAQIKKEHDDFISELANGAPIAEHDMRPPRLQGKGGALPDEENKRLENQVKKTMDALEAQIATFGKSKFEVEDYKRKLEGWTAAERENARELEHKLALLQANADWTKKIGEAQKAARAAEAEKQSRTFLESVAGPGFETGKFAAGGGPLPNLSNLISPAADVATQVKNLADEYERLIADAGKSDLEKKIKSLGPAATQEEIQSLKALDEQYKIVQAGGLDRYLLKIYETQKRLRQEWDDMALSVGGFNSKVAATLDQLARQGDDFGKKISQSIVGAIDSAESVLAHSIVTGKKANFTQVAQGLEENVVKASLQKTLGFGLEKLGIKTDKLGTRGNPMFVSVVNGPLGGGVFGRASGAATPPFAPSGAGGIGAIFRSIFGASSQTASAKTPPWLAESLPLPGAEENQNSSSSTSSILGPIFKGIFSGLKSSSDDSDDGGGGGSIFGSILSKIFGGFRAGGGDVTPGKAYVVGENKRAELFVPHTAGRIFPSTALAGAGGSTHYNSIEMHIHGASDPDAFERSSGQIAAAMYREISNAASRY